MLSLQADYLKFWQQGDSYTSVDGSAGFAVLAVGFLAFGISGRFAVEGQLARHAIDRERGHNSSLHGQ